MTFPRASRADRGLDVAKYVRSSNQKQEACETWQWLCPPCCEDVRLVGNEGLAQQQMINEDPLLAVSRALDVDGDRRSRSGHTVDHKLHRKTFGIPQEVDEVSVRVDVGRR